MKVLHKTDEDFIILPSNDPFIKANISIMLEMGYELLEDWTPPEDPEDCGI